MKVWLNYASMIINLSIGGNSPRAYFSNTLAQRPVWVKPWKLAVVHLPQSADASGLLDTICSVADESAEPVAVIRQQHGGVLGT